MSLYTSLRLSNDGRSVRHLRIEPNANHTSLVVCYLHVTAIYPELQYEALSYCWESPKIRSAISVNGIETSVTKNLAPALHAMRNRDSPRTLWVDAIRINQENSSEKASQIHLIALVYGKCSRVVIWLGESDKKSQKAFALVRNGMK